MTPRRAVLDPAAWRRVLVLAPHPDDETLATGGLIQRALAAGAQVRVVFVTDGEDNPWPQRVLERRWRLAAADRARWAARRRAEALAALACLGASASSVVFLRFPDQGLTSLLLSGGAEVVSVLTAELTAWRPTLVVAPAPADRHPDHNALAVLLRLAVDRIGAIECRFAELAYVVHGNGPGAATLRLLLGPAERARKQTAILRHGSQLILSRRRFLSHALPTEQFFDPATSSPAHRVRAATFASGTLSLQLAAPRSLAAALPATLDVLTEDNPGCVVRWRSRRVRPGEREVELPLDRMPARLLVKCEGQRLFFDEAGWREVPLGEEEAAIRDRLSVERAAQVAHPATA